MGKMVTKAGIAAVDDVVIVWRLLRLLSEDGDCPAIADPGACAVNNDDDDTVWQMALLGRSIVRYFTNTFFIFSAALLGFQPIRVYLETF
ncbi:unnamed protein product [Protopolystoma xenopodis]|uniref:Uncharacterized protein n=1 Tax=Protopolystoma xenopodis TaxID=117903 RepID=A0A3S5AWQ6_9PLAT|nr:unnamed protein product [Protopolystoma xenopodis]